jgi:hypothetical protein
LELIHEERIVTPFQERSPNHTASYPDGPQSVGWKAMLLRLKFLEPHGFGFLRFEPIQETCKPLVDVVDVESCNVHAVAFE